MPVLTNSVEINATPELVFDYASDMMNELEWNPKIVSMRRLDDGPIRVGSSFQAEWPGSGPAHVEITALDRPRSWSAFSRGGGLDIAFEGRVTPTSAGSKLTIVMDLRPRGLMKLMTPLLARMMQQAEARNLPAVRTAIENRYRSAGFSGS